MPSNVENILGAILTGDGSGIQKPASRVEELLFEIYEQGGGGGGDSVIGGIKLTIDSDFVMTATLVDKDGEEYGVSDDIDLPLEEMVVDAEYDPLTQKIKLELKNGNYVEFSVAELVSGLQTELSSSNKLNPAYIDYDASHRAVSDTEKSTWNAKQNAISDLEAIRSGASAGATAVQPSTLETALAGKQDTISDLAAIRSGASAGATAVQPATMETALALKQDSLSETQLAAVNSGINSTKVAQIETNKANISYTMNRVGKNILPIDLKTLKARNTHGTWVGNSYTEYGITFTINDDCTVSISGTNTSSNDNALLKLVTYLDYLPEIQAGRYTLSGCPSGGSTQSYYLSAHRAKTTGTVASYTETGSEVTGEFDYSLATTNQSNISIAIAASYAITGTIVFSPMLRNASIEDGTYEHYALPNYELTKLESEDRAALVEAIDNGVKNLLPKLKSHTASGLSMVINDDNSITAKWSATGSSTLYARINDNNWTLPRGTYVLSGMPNTNNIGCYIHIETNTSQLVVQQERNTPVEFTIASDYEYLKIYISVRPNSAAETSGVTILPMIVTKAISDIGENIYVPPTLPNYELTKLESEDRAALVECVDEGAKNRFDWKNSEVKTYNPYHATVSKTESSFTITSADVSAAYGFVLSLPKGDYVLTTTISNFSGSNSCWCVIAVGEPYSLSNVINQYTFNDNCNIELHFTLTQTSSVYIMYYANKVGTSYIDTTSFTASNLMICTEEEFKISPAHAPFALPNTDLTRMVNDLHERTDQIQPVVKFDADVAGWYRVFTLGSTNSVATVGAYDNSCDIIIKRLFANTNNEHHEIKLASIFENMGFTDEFSKSAVLLITNIRYVSTSNSAYIDIYYSGSTMNTMVCSVNNNAGEVSWKAVNTVSRVSETTTGETVWASYDFNANYDPSFLAAKSNVATVATTDTEALYSDLTVTVPPYTAYRITAFLNYNDTAPKSITLSVSDNPSDYAGRHLISKATNPSSELLGQLVTSSVVIATGNNAKNVYVWASSLSAGNNRIYILFEKLAKF